MSSLPEQLKALRLDHQYTQSDIAKMLGCGISGVSSYESGARTPNYEIILKYADFFQVSTDYLLGHETISDTNVSTSNRKYIDVTNLSDSDIKALETLVRSLQKRNS